MLSKEFIDNISFPVTQLYMACENRLLALIIRRLKAGTGGFVLDEWYIEKLFDMGGLSREAISEIAKTSKKAQALLSKVLSEVTKKSLAEDGIDAVETKGVRQTVKALQAQAQNHLNLVNTTMLAGTQDSFGTMVAVLDNERNRILNDAAMDLATGQQSYRQIVANTIRRLGEEGINAYVDKAGRQWTPEAYVSMDLRTTCSQTARKVVEEQGRDYGMDIILVSSHAGARPGCAPFQGRCYSMSDQSGTIKDANGNTYEYEPISVTGYDPASGLNQDPAGLFGINCGHSFRYIEAGAFFNREETLDTEAERRKNAKVYAQSQEQRQIEREIRKYARESDLLKEAGLTEFAKIPAGNARSARDEYRSFCEQTGRTPRWDRTQIY